MLVVNNIFRLKYPRKYVASEVSIGTLSIIVEDLLCRFFCFGVTIHSLLQYRSILFSDNITRITQTLSSTHYPTNLFFFF